MQPRRVVRRAAAAIGVEDYVDGVRYALSSPKRRQGIRDHGNIAMLVGFLLGPDDNCIDVGANHGYVLERAVHAAPLGHHVAYEPIPQLAEQLRRRFPSADVRNAAVSDAAGVMPFHFVRTEDGLSGFHNVDFDGTQRGGDT